jgi:hypothetical protein
VRLIHAQIRYTNSVFNCVIELEMFFFSSDVTLFSLDPLNKENFKGWVFLILKMAVFWDVAPFSLVW